MQTRTVGLFPSAETDDMAEMVTPDRPAGPSVVTTLTQNAARLIPSMNCARISGSAGRTLMAGTKRSCLVSSEEMILSFCGVLFCGVLDLPERKPLADGAIAGAARLLFLDDLVGQASGLAHEIQRSIPVEIPVHRGQMRERRRLRKQLERQAMAGIVRVQEVARKGKQASPVLGDPLIVDGVEFLEPWLGFSVLEGRLVGRHADLPAA